MATVIPETLQEQIAFFQNRLASWNTNKTAIGLTATDITNITNAVTAAQAKLQAAEVARLSSKNATNDEKIAQNNLLSVGRVLVKAIKAKAASTHDPNVYSLASIPPPSPPTPAPPLEVAKNVQLYMNTDGDIVLMWEGSTRNIFYGIERILDGQSQYMRIGYMGGLKFVDTTVPQGAKSATYRIITARGEEESPGTSPVTITLGAIQKAA